MILVKVGGGATIDWDAIAEDLAKLTQREKIVIVHGASVKRDQIAKRLGSPTKTVTSPSGITSVYTDQQALEIFLMVYSGLSNKQIVANLLKHGLPAVGLSGVDGKLWLAKPKKELLSKEGNKTKLLRNNRTGRVESINLSLMKLLLDAGYIPVISAPAISYENEIVNTDNDWGAAVTAASLKADKLVYLFEAPGLMKDINDQSSLISKIEADMLSDCLPYAKGRMKKKLLAAQKAIELGMKTVFWGDGRIKNPIVSALAGKGTVISKQV